MQARGITQQRATISSSLSGAASCRHMASDTLTLMDGCDNISTWVTGGVTGCIPHKVCRVMPGMTYRTIGMAIQTLHRRTSHDDIIH